MGEKYKVIVLWGGKPGPSRVESQAKVTDKTEESFQRANKSIGYID